MADVHKMASDIVMEVHGHGAKLNEINENMEEAKENMENANDELVINKKGREGKFKIMLGIFIGVVLFVLLLIGIISWKFHR